jgi:hypothetical protein
MKTLHHFAGTLPFGAALFAAAMALGDSADDRRGHSHLSPEAEIALEQAQNDFNLAIAHQSLDAATEIGLRRAYRAAEAGDSDSVKKFARSASESARMSLIGTEGSSTL